MIIGKRLNLEEFRAIVEGKAKIDIDDEVKKTVVECFDFLEDFSKDKVIYGINTGFGPMSQWRIPDAHLIELQYNIIRSHSTGAGEPLPAIYVRASMLSRLMTFLQAHSGVNFQSCR